MANKKKLASSRLPELGAGARLMHKNLMTIIISKSITTMSQSQQRTNHAQINFLTYTYLGEKKRTKLSAAPPAAVSWRSYPRRLGRTTPAGTRRGRDELPPPPGLAGRASRRSRPDPGRASRRSRPEPATPGPLGLAASHAARRAPARAAGPRKLREGGRG